MIAINVKPQVDFFTDDEDEEDEISNEDYMFKNNYNDFNNLASENNKIIYPSHN